MPSTAQTATPGAASAGLSLQFAGVTKRYATQTALRDVTLHVAGGECVVLRGSNGAGKTTLLRLAAGLVRPSSGSVTLSQEGAGGHAPQEEPEARQRCGLVAHATMLYDDFTAEENLQFFARLYGVDGSASRCDELLERCGLASRRAHPVRTFSRGMKQRLAIARALLPSPGLLLLDEPATGLDAQGMEWLEETLASLHGGGCTLVMSTHGASSLHGLATRAVLLERGRVAADSGAGGDPRRLLEQSSGGAASATGGGA